MQRPNVLLALVVCILSGIFASSAHAGLFKKKVVVEPVTQDEIVLAQVFLDEMLLGPGKVDGKVGEFTRHAVGFYNLRWRLTPDNWYRVMREAERQIKSPYAYYTVQTRDLRFVGPVPAEPAEQEKLDYLSYRSLAEFVSERFHTTEGFLQKLNPNLNVQALRPGQQLVVPNVTPFQIETIRKHEKYGAAAGLSTRLVYVDTNLRVAKIFDEGKLVAAFPITPGAKKFIPYGDWKVKIMVTTPEFRWDKKMLEQGERGDEAFQLPPGPNSPVGIFWAGLNKSGIGLHGTNNPGSIGRSQSAGCIRLANWDAIRLRGLIRPGATVLVR